MRILVPNPATFAWSGNAVAPSIPLSTDATGSHTWTWTLTWKTFSAHGSVQTPDNHWDASVAAAQGGGSLVVKAQAGAASASATVTITGLNPSQQDVKDFLATQANGADFGKILLAESGAANFRNGEPIKSFDNGYGMCQLTTPPPTFVQAWNWHSNVQGGLALFAGKRAIATNYLNQGGRTCTDAQLLYETVSLWNGGHYHVWNGSAWVRNPNVLCDRQTGNIGWDMTLPVNAGKTEATLHQRDSAQYRAGRTPAANWRYFGVCYADHILG